MGPLDLLGSKGFGEGGGGRDRRRRRGGTSRQHSETWGKMCVAWIHAENAQHDTRVWPRLVEEIYVTC